MKNTIVTLFWGIIFLLGCSKQNESSRIHFTINPHNQKIIIPFQLNDRVTANLTFDTGIGTSKGEAQLVLGLNFIEVNPGIDLGPISKESTYYFAWDTVGAKSFIYEQPCTVHINSQIDLTYDDVLVTDIRKLGADENIDGIFNIPSNDTTHIWELNFENNYLEVHEADGFKFPDECFILPYHDKFERPFFIDMPLQIKCFNGDSITLAGNDMFIDTAAPNDISIFPHTKEFPFFDKKEDGVWLYITMNPGYFKYDIVNANIFDGYEIDSMRIYSRYSNIMVSDYIIGLNFLKRFNVFLDVRNKQIGFQPIGNFQRIPNLISTVFHIKFSRTPSGTIIIEKLANSKNNYYKIAGMQEGDEITAINDIPFGSITDKDRDFFQKQDSLIYTLLRDGKLLTLIVRERETAYSN